MRMGAAGDLPRRKLAAPRRARHRTRDRARSPLAARRSALRLAARGQAEGEHRPALRELGPHAAAEGAHGLAHDAQAEPRPLDVLGAVLVGAEEAAEEPRALVLGDAEAVVAHAHDHLRAALEAGGQL